MPPSKPELITSFRNEHIKGALGLRDRSARNETGLTIVEGWREARRAEGSGVEFKEIYLCKDLYAGREDKELLKILFAKGIPVFETSSEIFAKISFGDRQEGVLALVKPAPLKLADLKVGSNPLLVVVEGVEKPGNLGAMVRTCDGADVDALIVCDAGTDIFNPNVIRSSLGTVFSVQIITSTNELVHQYLKKQNIKVCATLPGAKTLYSQADLKGPLAVIVGSEQAGLSKFWVEHSNLSVKIPMLGAADSLNVATTAAIIIYEAIRQRN